MNPLQVLKMNLFEFVTFLFPTFLILFFIKRAEIKTRIKFL